MKLLQAAAILFSTGFSASAGTLTFSSDLGSSSIPPGPSLDGTANMAADAESVIPIVAQWP